VVVRVRERFEASKQTAHNFDVETFNLRKISELQFNSQYHNKISNRFAFLENLNVSEDRTD
jgi:hypothetical protein